MREFSAIVRVLKKPGGGENTHSVFDGFFRSGVHFKSEPGKVVRKEGDPFFGASPGLKNKCAVVYVDHAE